MRIVHALGWYFPESLGGTEIYVAALSKHLRAAGHDCLIAAPDPATESERTYEHDGLEVYRYPIPAAPTRAEAQGRERVRGTELFHRWLERTRPDVFHCHSIVTGLGLPEVELAKSLGARVVVTCHTPSLGFLCQRGTMLRWGKELCDGLALPAKCAACDLENRGVPSAIARLLASAPVSASRLGERVPGRLGTALGMPALVAHNLERQRRLLDSVDAFVVLTEWARRVVAANHDSEEKLFLNRLGIELNGGRETDPDRQVGTPVRFGFVGRFHPTKGLFVLAEAVASLPKDLPFSLELRGPATDEQDRCTLEQLRHLLGSDARVRLADAVKHNQVADVLAGFDVLLVPSIWLEGGPTVALEAQAAGTPIVGSRLGGLAEIVEDGVNGILVTPGDAGALAETLENIVRHPSIVQRWRRKLPPVVTMRAVTDRYLKLYAD